MVIWGWWILNKTISRYPGESKISLQQIHCIQRIVHRQNTIERSGRKSHKTRTVESRTVQLSLSPACTWSSTRHHIFPSQTSSSRSRPNASKGCSLTLKIENYFDRTMRFGTNAPRSCERKRSIRSVNVN